MIVPQLSSHVKHTESVGIYSENHHGEVTLGVKENIIINISSIPESNIPNWRADRSE